VWQGPTLTTPPTIQGHLAAVVRHDSETTWAQTSAGVIEAGQMRFFTEWVDGSGNPPKEGDIVEDPDGLGGPRQYRIMGLVRSGHLLASRLGTPGRREFDVREVPQ
jgi:hypothetical protein